MGILLTPVSPADRLLTLTQDGHSIEQYVEEFLELSYLRAWNEATLKNIFWIGLDDYLYQQVPAGTIPSSLAQYLDYVLWLSGSSLTVCEVDNTTATQPQLPSSIPVSSPQSRATLSCVPSPMTAPASSPEQGAMCKLCNLVILYIIAFF
ncbi:hypothetical protein ABG768_019093 [Culter alburnus]|uniref:Retrotransposon gag domain-containing protein n=1 Tax=Culter alburnus TaxID=194366 RepID=A0AAW2AX19_CULAL